MSGCSQDEAHKWRDKVSMRCDISVAKIVIIQGQNRQRPGKDIVQRGRQLVEVFIDRTYCKSFISFRIKMQLHCGIVLLCGMFTFASATLRLPSIFASSMVLPQDTVIPFSGTSNPLASIQVQVDDQTVLTTKASSTGDWTVLLPAMKGILQCSLHEVSVTVHYPLGTQNQHHSNSLAHAKATYGLVAVIIASEARGCARWVHLYMLGAGMLPATLQCTSQHRHRQHTYMQSLQHYWCWCCCVSHCYCRE